MAPTNNGTSKSSKKRVAARRTTPAKKSMTSSSSKKLVVVRSHHKNNKKDGKTTSSKPVPILPSDWPVTSHPTKFPINASALPPGSLLRNRCSGQDIHITKSAVATPNIDKERGKYLLIFPGIFSFHNINNDHTKTSVDNRKGDKDKQTTNEDDDEDKDNDDEDKLKDDKTLSKGQPDADTNNSKEEGSVDKMTTSAAPTSNKLGKLEGLRTDTPIFKIPFPQLQKVLIFPGKKVQTTSKYLMLSCSNKSKGSVQCKSIFSSAIIFGKPKWDSWNESAVTSAANNTLRSIAKTDSNDNDNLDGPTTNQAYSLAHYGGSARTIDGTLSKGNKKRLSIDNDEIDLNKYIPIWSKQSKQTNSTSALGFPGMEENSVTPISIVKKNPSTSYSKPKTQNIDLSSSDNENDEDNNDDSDSDGDFEISFPVSVTTSATKTRAAPKRQAALNRKRYVAEEESDVDDENDDNSSNESEKDVDDEMKEVRPPPSKRKKSGKADRKSKIASNKSKAKQPTSTAQDKIVDLAQGNEKCDASDENKNHNKQGQKKSWSERISEIKKSSILEVLSSSSDSELNLEKNTSTNTSSMEKKRASNASDSEGAPRRKKAKIKKTFESSGDSDGDSSIETPRTDNVVISRRCAPRRSVYGRKKSYKEIDEESEESDKASSNDESDVDDKKTSSKPRTSTVKGAKRVVQPKKSSTESKKPLAEGKLVGTTSPGIRQKPTTPLSPSSPSSGVKSPFRRRRKSPAGKTPGSNLKPKILDLTHDDEFNFG